MKDIFAKRANDSFFDILSEFINSLNITFPNCVAIQNWKTQHQHDCDKDRISILDDWLSAMDAPLSKGCTRYAKAVASIIGCPCSVYHSIAYHDIDALHISSKYFSPFNFPLKLKTMQSSDIHLFWQYMKEINTQAYLATRRQHCAVPTPQEIGDNIQKRKKIGFPTNNNTGNNKNAIESGFVDGWNCFCQLRAVAVFDDIDVCSKMHTLSSTKIDDITVEEGCRNKYISSFHKVVATFPYIGDALPSDAEWNLLNKCFALSTMHNTIPPPMMQGIEKIANELVGDISSGVKRLEDLNVESIGQSVLSNISQAEIGTFAENLHKILPAIQSMGLN